MSNENANLFIIAAPSGAGKSSLINALINRAVDGQMFNPAELSVSHTTRLPREGEKDGVHYHFTDKTHFENLIAQDAFYEYAQVFDNYYGTSKAAIADKLQQGVDVFLDIDWQGARQIKSLKPDVISIFILPPSKEELHARLVSRGKDDSEVIERRMAQAQSEMSHHNEFDFTIINDNFSHAVEELVTIVKACGLQTKQQALRHKALVESLLS